MNINDAKLIEKIIFTLNLVVNSEKKRKILFEGVKLYSSEIHLISFIFLEQNRNISNIAKKLGLTKGAISQSVSRLVRKGIINKKTDPTKKNELNLEFTSKGNQILNYILGLKKKVEIYFKNYIEVLTDEHKKNIDNFLSMITKFYES